MDATLNNNSWANSKLQKQIADRVDKFGKTQMAHLKQSYKQQGHKYPLQHQSPLASNQKAERIIEYSNNLMGLNNHIHIPGNSPSDTLHG